MTKAVNLFLISALFLSVGALASAKAKRFIAAENAAPPVACFGSAIENIHGFSSAESAALTLCAGTTSPTAPIDCYKAAIAEVSNANFVSSAEAALVLCAGTSSATAPVDCFKSALKNLAGSNFSSLSSAALALCAGTNSASAPIDCFKSASTSLNGMIFTSPSSAELMLCSNHPPK